MCPRLLVARGPGAHLHSLLGVQGGARVIQVPLRVSPHQFLCKDLRINPCVFSMCLSNDSWMVPVGCRGVRGPHPSCRPPMKVTHLYQRWVWSIAHSNAAVVTSVASSHCSFIKSKPYLALGAVTAGEWSTHLFIETCVEGRGTSIILGWGRGAGGPISGIQRAEQESRGLKFPLRNEDSCPG